MLSRNAKSRRRKQKNAISNSYQSLEDRRLLVTYVGFDAATGTMDILMTSNGDTAVVDVTTDANKFVTVNGSTDLDTRAAGTQAFAIGDVKNVNVVNRYNTSTLVRQATEFNGDFTEANGADLQDITVNGSRFVTFNGNYELAGDLAVATTSLDRGGLLSDGASGNVVVAGTTSLTTTNDNRIEFDNGTSDFVGDVSITATGSTTLTDANDLSLAMVDVNGDIVVNAANITDAAGSMIDVSGTATFNGTSVVLGDDATDVVNVGVWAGTTTGLYEINEDSTVVLGDLSVQELTARTDAGIFDGRTSFINVAGTATMEGESLVILGDNGTDRFNAGSLNFKSLGHVHVWQDSTITLTGQNSAGSIDLFSEGSIVDDANADLAVNGSSGFSSAADVILGDSIGNDIRNGSVHFFAVGDFNLSEDDGIHIVETKNSARRMFLTTPEGVTDSADAQVTIERIADFTADRVNVGESATDLFNAGSISFDTANGFRLSENSDSNIVGFNTANSVELTSTGAITDVFTAATGEGTSLNVVTTATFEGATITLGDEAMDEMNFGALVVKSPGKATVTEDSSTLLTGASDVGELKLTSTGAILDSTFSNTTVQGLAEFSGTSIALGDSATDLFNAVSLTVDSVGAVSVIENTSLNLFGTNRASSLFLTSLSGAILDDVNADTVVTGLMTVQGTLVNMGSEATDNLEFGSLTFVSTTMNTFITADSDINIVGTNLAGDQLLLTSVGDISDAADADMRATNRAVFTGVDIQIGELAGDCFDIVNGDVSDLVVIASGTVNDVTLGC